MKIGIVTIYAVPNYGSVLQAFATQVLLEQFGNECKIINYTYPNKWHYKHGAVRPNPLRKLLSKLGLRSQHRKNRILQQFRRRYFHFTPKYADLEALNNENWGDYDAFVSGSDQVWNFRYLKGDSVFMLSFVPHNKPCYSIASSFALNELPKEQVCKYKAELAKYKALSVRELAGANIIKQQLGLTKEVFVCLDPTLLLCKENWLRILPCHKSHSQKKHPYILLYMWTYAFEPRPYIFEVIKYFQKTLNLDIIALEGYTPPQKANGIRMKCAEDSTIPEFLNLFDNADLVITSSFHGTAFALNFSRPLVSVVPNNNQDDRQTNLLKKLGAESCIVQVGQEINTINPNYDKEKVCENLEELRKECIKWIRENIK